MLDIAQKYESELKKLLIDTWYEDKYKFYHNSVYSQSYKAEESTWSKHEFVSINKNGNIIGYIGYCVDREAEKVYSLAAINFSDDKITFGRDIAETVKNIFVKYNFRKLSYNVVVGNPVESTYDKMTEKYGGRIVGTHKEDVKLIDNKYYDSKEYEIFRENFMKTLTA